MSFVFKRTAEWWLLLCVVSLESSSAHVVAVMLRTMFSIQINSSSKFWISKLKCLEFNIHQNNRTYQFHLLNQDLHQNVFQFHFIKLCHISQKIIPWFDPALFANITLFKVNKSGNSFKWKQNNQNFQFCLLSKNNLIFGICLGNLTWKFRSFDFSKCAADKT